MIYFEAPLHINPPAGGAIGACPATDGRGRGWVRKTVGAEKDRNLKLIRCNLFSHSPSRRNLTKLQTSRVSIPWRSS
jgi:hypothetical protein